MMTILWKGIQVTLGLFLIAGLLFASGVFAVLLYGKITGQAWLNEPVLSGPVVHADQSAQELRPLAGITPMLQ